MRGRRGPKPLDPMQRVMRRVDRQANGCWQWLGAADSKGNRYFKLTASKQVYVARWLSGAADGTECRRTCDTPARVSPDHHVVMTAADKFWANVAPDAADACWLWTGHLHKGYGRFGQVLAHRWAYEHLRGDIPRGLTIDHLCFTPTCVNPWHLEPVPQTENTRRMHERRPQARVGDFSDAST
jgi:hypothetical protein